VAISLVEAWEIGHCVNCGALPNSILFFLGKIGEIIEQSDKVITALSGLAVAAFTGTLWWSTRKLWRVTAATLDHAERTAIRELRAYISVKEIIMDQFRSADTVGVYGTVVEGQVHNYRISALIENGGSTPTRKAIINVNWELRGDKLPNDFQFPDGKITEAAAVGARGTYVTPGFFVSVADIRKIMAKEKRLYVWGWIDYNDVFEGTPRHRTEFCFDISPDEVPDGKNIYMRFPTHGRFNGTDGDCLRRPQPHAEPDAG
jgi:hypothetical protein